MPRGFLDGLRATVAQAWGDIRVAQVSLPPRELPERRLLLHVVTLNLGPEVARDANLGGRGWQTYRTPHHGVSVLPALLPYAAREREERETLIVEVAPAFVPVALGSAAGGAALRPVLGERDSFSEHVLLALGEEARATSPGGAVRVAGLATALVAHLVDRDPHPAASGLAGLPSAQLRRVLDHVAARLDAPLRLQTLARLAGMDVFRFIRTFKQSTGLSPHRYVMEARIARAQELLADRSLSITEIALRTGFATPSHFSVTFRRIARVTPRAYRDALP